MIGLSLPQTFRLLAIGAHPDDVEIGAGGSLLAWQQRVSAIDYVIATGAPDREAEARVAVSAFLPGVTAGLHFPALPDGRLPSHFDEVKDVLRELAATVDADVVLAPSPADAHQDHRLLGQAVRTEFRNHLILHYEIPKWDGDLGAGAPNLYQGLTPEQIEAKWELLQRHFGSQADRDWFHRDTFVGLAKLRGNECRQPYAEAFTASKLRVA